MYDYLYIYTYICIHIYLSLSIYIYPASCQNPIMTCKPKTHYKLMFDKSFFDMSERNVLSLQQFVYRRLFIPNRSYLQTSPDVTGINPHSQPKNTSPWRLMAHNVLCNSIYVHCSRDLRRWCDVSCSFKSPKCRSPISLSHSQDKQSSIRPNIYFHFAYCTAQMSHTNVPKLKIL